ncbi:glycosyltransferase family 4 protein [uncultured Butyricimonas sp.]|uniref:glycosyltransferase family 4 protein n=1 Tax=uncultured Butyricimonas sp. TaxID=1268785 RepID=UPI0026DBB2A6|nr:glycosyltransferase family 4 protein [uncultured Butyricimonas sp.]
MNIFDEVLFIGPDFNNRGGISSVLKLYKENIESFHYIKSSTDKGLLVNVWVLGVVLVKLIGVRFLRKIKIIHLHGASWHSFQRKAIIIIWVKILGFKVIFHCHGGEFKQYVESKGRRGVKGVLDKCDAIIVLSKYWYDYFINELGQTRVFVVNNMVNRPQKINKRIDGLLHLLFLGVITKEKGIFDLVNVINEHKEELKGKCTLIIGGSGIEKNINQLVRYIEENCLHDLIDYKGWVNNETKELVFAESNVFILPSYMEGLPISILEAMSNEMPIISTFVGGIPAIVTTNNGVLVRPGDKTAIWLAIKNYINNINIIIEQGKESAKLVEIFYPQKVEEQLVLIYSQL